MMIREIASRFRAMNYQFVNARSLIANEDYLQVAFVQNKDIINYVIMLDNERFSQADSIRRALQQTFYEFGVNEVHGLLILCTKDLANTMVDPYMPTWIVDEESMRLVIYENQPVQFVQAKQAVEQALYGVPKKVQISNIPIVTIILVLANFVMFLITELTGSSLDTDHMLDMGASYAPYILDQHEYYRLITHFFLHFGIAHLANNMFSLIILGNAVEKQLGKMRFFLVYFLTGILAGLASIVYNVYVGENLVVSAGASGAIYGLAGALLALLLCCKAMREKGQALWFIVYIGVSIYSGMSDPSIDNSAHISGFIIGFLLCLVMTLVKRRKVNQQ